MPQSIMPASASGAYVSCYAFGEGYEEAAAKCLAALHEDGLEVAEILSPVQSMDVGTWSQHVAEQWPDHASHLPPQSEFEDCILSGRVVYGPFGAY
jgi:hypothetical protein